MKRFFSVLQWTAVAFVVLMAVGCARSTQVATPRAGPPAVAGEERTQFAMRYIDVAPGAGAEAAPDKCHYVHYTGWLTDGTKFDSSRDTTPQGQPRTPLSFHQGRRNVIPGWDAGFEGMRVGGKRRLIIPYQLAYGINGRPPVIPPRATLIFDVELMDVRDGPPATRPPEPAARCPAWDARSDTSRLGAH